MTTGILEQVYELSNRIVHMYGDLLHDDFYINDLTKRRELIADIRKLVLQEYDLLSLVSLDELDKYLAGSLKPQKKYSHKVNERVYNKMLNLNSRVKGEGITGSQLGIPSLPSNMSFSIYDALVSMIDIDVVKRLKEKIYSLQASNTQDINFVCSLKEKLRNSSLDLLYNMSTIEMIALSYSGSIKLMPRIDRSKLENSLENINPNFTTFEVDLALEEYAKCIIDKMASVGIVKNNPNAVFDYLVLYTKMEILVNSCSIKQPLESMRDYCIKLGNDHNQASLGVVKQLIKMRTDSIECN